MMRWNRFGRSLLFAAVAAAAFVPFALLTLPSLGRSGALVAFAIASAATYVAGLGASVRQGVGAALLLGATAGVTALLTPDPRDAILATALLLGLCRSGLLYRTRFARAVLWEAALLGTGLAVAGHLLASSTFATVLAIWSFYLIQSVFFLVGGVEVRRSEDGAADPFDAARARALALLDDAETGRAP